MATIKKDEDVKGWYSCHIPFHAESVEKLAEQMKDCLARIGGAVRHLRIEGTIALLNDDIYTDDGFAEYNRRMDKLLRVWPIGAEEEIADIRRGKLRGDLPPCFPIGAEEEIADIRRGKLRGDLPPCFPKEGVKVPHKPITAAMLKGEDV